MWVVLSLCLMYGDQNISWVHRLRLSSTVIVAPLQYAVDTPFRIINTMRIGISSKAELQDTNQALRAHELMLESRLQQMMFLKKENKQLRQILHASSQLAARMAVTHLIAADLNPNEKQILIDKGSDHDVFVGQPVLDSHGVVGQVVDVYANASRVLLLTDSLSRIPLQNNRTGDRVIAMGVGRPRNLFLMNIQAQDNIKVGDVYSTSGMGLRYPQGYPVAVVNAVGSRLANNSKQVRLSLLAQPQHDRLLLLLWPHGLQAKSALLSSAGWTASTSAGGA